MNWIPFGNDTQPRRGEIIVVRSKAGVYDRLLIVEGTLKFWVYHGADRELYERGDFSGTSLSFHGLTEWMLIESPY
jgi:hypothetical protein